MTMETSAEMNLCRRKPCGTSVCCCPAVIGLCVAAKGNAVDGICAAVNIGDDTDTVATMVGGILGALHGADAFPEHYFKVIEEANGFGLDALAEKMVRFIG